jgi:hypothetical protein
MKLSEFFAQQWEQQVNAYCMARVDRELGIVTDEAVEAACRENYRAWDEYDSEERRRPRKCMRSELEAETP